MGIYLGDKKIQLQLAPQIKGTKQDKQSWTDGTQTSIANVPTNSPSFHLGIGDEPTAGDVATINVPFIDVLCSDANAYNLTVEAYVVNKTESDNEKSIEEYISTDNKTTKTYSYDSTTYGGLTMFSYGNIYKNTSNTFYYAQLSGSCQYISDDGKYHDVVDQGDGSYSIATGWNSLLYDFGFMVYPNDKDPFASMDSNKSMIFTYINGIDPNTNDFKNLFFFVPSGYTLCAVLLNGMVHQWAPTKYAYFDLVCSDTFNYYSQSDQQEELDAISAITTELTARGNTITSLNTQGQNLVSKHNTLVGKYNNIISQWGTNKE